MQSPPVLCKHLKDRIGGMKLTMKVRCLEERNRDWRGVRLWISWKGAKLQGSWTWTHMNKLEERSRTSTTFGIFSAQKREKEREILVIIEAYMWSRWMRMMLEGFLHLIQALNLENMDDLWEKKSVCSWCSWAAREREI